MGKSTIIIIGMLSPGMVLTVPLATGSDSAYVLIDYGSNAGGVKTKAPLNIASQVGNRNDVEEWIVDT